MENSAFITGSRAYGTPRPDSDVDLAVLVENRFLSFLFSIADKVSERSAKYENSSLRFGKLNIILFTEDEKWKFDAWRAATTELISRRPVTKLEAIECIQKRLRGKRS